MEQFKKAVRIAGVNLGHMCKDLRVWTILLFTALVLFDYMNLYVKYGIETGQKCTAYVLPLLFDLPTASMGYLKITIYVFMLLLLCDVPFFYPITPYFVIRSRRESWWLGQCLYIFCVSFCYMLFITVICMLMLLPVISFRDNWDGVVKEIALGRVGEESAVRDKILRIAPFPADVVRYLYPMASQLYTFLAGWASFSLLGLIMYTVGLYQRNALWGIGIGTFFIFLDPLLIFLFSRHPWVYIFSPVTWSSLKSLDLLDNKQKLITMPLVFVMYFALVAILLVIIRTITKKAVVESM